MGLRDLSQILAPTFLSGPALTKTLGEDFVLCDKGTVLFHWADFFETCDLVKARLEREPALEIDLKRREGALAKLALVPVWIRTENQVHQTTIFDLYEKYLLNHIQSLGLDPFSPLDISFISPTGPFKVMSIAECFNPTTYRDFVIVYLLQGKLPRRDFRIRLKSKILMEHGKDFAGAELVALEQLTTSGLLLSLDADAYTRKISVDGAVRFLVNAASLGPALGKSLAELRPFLSQFAHNFLYSSVKSDAIDCHREDLSVQSAFDFSKNKKVFLFVSFEKLARSNPASVELLRDFVAHARGLVREHFREAADRRVA
jgi:hypothetical protein